MTIRDVYRRIKQARNRPQDAFRRFTRRSLLRTLGIDFSKQTELQYVELGLFRSSIISKTLITQAKEIVFLDTNVNFRHNFESKFIIEITNVLVNTETNHIYVSSKSKDEYLLLKESSSWSTENVLLNAQKPTKSSAQKVVKVALGLPNSGFYHLIAEDLPNLLLSDQEHLFLLNKESSKTHRKILQILGKEIVECDKWVRVESLTFVTKGQDLGYLHPRGAEVLKEFGRGISSSNKQGTEKIYVSRSNSRRSLSSETSIENYLSKKGFRIIRAEDLTITEQIVEFSQAKLIVGIHGAGLSNAIWPNKCSIIELMPTNRINRCFEWQANICDSPYRVLYFDPSQSAEVTVIPQLEGLDL